LEDTTLGSEAVTRGGSRDIEVLGRYADGKEVFLGTNGRTIMNLDAR